MYGHYSQDRIEIASAVEQAGAQVPYMKMITDQKARVGQYNKKAASITSYPRYEEVNALDTRHVDTGNQWAQDVVESMEE